MKGYVNACAALAARDHRLRLRGAHPTDIPFLTGRVVDNAEILSPAASDKITGLLKAHETQTTDQVVVLTVPSLEGRSIEEYAVAVFESWKLGQKGKDNGVLLVIVLRASARCASKSVTASKAASPTSRRTASYATSWPRVSRPATSIGGVEEGVRAILSELRGESDAVADAKAESRSGARSGSSGLQIADLSITERILFGAFIFGIIGLFTIIGVLTPGVGWFLYLFLIPFWAMFPIVVVGTQGALILLVTYLIAFPLAKLIVSRTAWYAKAQRDMKTKGTRKRRRFRDRRIERLELVVELGIELLGRRFFGRRRQLGGRRQLRKLVSVESSRERMADQLSSFLHARARAREAPQMTLPLSARLPSAAMSRSSHASFRASSTSAPRRGFSPAGTVSCGTAQRMKRRSRATDSRHTRAIRS